MNTTRLLVRIVTKCCERRLSVISGLNNKVVLNDFTIRSPLPGISIKGLNFFDRIWKDVDGWRNKIAIESAETGKSYTYEQLLLNIDRWATSLKKKLGLQKNDVVAIMLANVPEFPIVAFGSIKAGCRVTTINPAYKEFEITHQLTVTHPKVVVTSKDCYETVVAALKIIKLNPKIVMVDEIGESIPAGCIRFTELGENGTVDSKLLNGVQHTQEDIAFLPFSSGTTGLPKGVEISHRNMLSTLEMISNEKICLADLANGSHQDVVPCVLPFFHIYGLVVTLTAHLSRGCKLVSIKKFTTDRYLDTLKNKRASILYIVPPIVIFLGKHPSVTPEHLQSVRYALSGAAPLAATDVELVLQKQRNIEFIQAYGATETTSLGTTMLKGEPRDFSTVGVPVPSVEMRIADIQTGAILPPDQEGELQIRGPNVMRGYYQNEEATRDSFTEDGFFKTGDLAFYKKGWGITITDRIKELIKVKGMQVAPAELEGLLRTHPAVADAAVVGVPHELYGEIPKAFVVAKAEKKIVPEELQHFIASKVASYKKVEEVEIVESLPKTASGKILRRELKKMCS